MSVSLHTMPLLADERDPHCVAVVASGMLVAAFGVAAMSQDKAGRITVRSRDGTEFSTNRPDIDLTRITSDVDFAITLVRIRNSFADFEA